MSSAAGGRGAAWGTPQRSVEEQLAWERRLGPRAAGAAFAGGALFFASSFYLNVALSERSRRADQALAIVDREPAHFVVSGLLVGVAALLLGLTLAYMYQATRFRRERTPQPAYVLALSGGVTALVVSVVQQVLTIDLASEFLASGARTEARARELRRADTGFQLTAGLALAAYLSLAFAMIVVSLNAMRTGLLSRFMGVLGVVIGALFPFAGAFPVLMPFWLVALGLVLIDRWPGGRGAAWSTGREEPWPSMAEQRAEMERRRAGEGEPPAEGAAGGAPAEAGGEGPPPERRPAKRKRRR